VVEVLVELDKTVAVMSVEMVVLQKMFHLILVQHTVKVVYLQEAVVEEHT
jgi:hypothetical protein